MLIDDEMLFLPPREFILVTSAGLYGYEELAVIGFLNLDEAGFLSSFFFEFTAYSFLCL